MKLDPAISQAVYAAFNAGDVDCFSTLLTAHPEFLRNADGTDRWMWQAAMNGRLEIVKSLVDVGLDVNESKDLVGPNDPFGAVEGAILWAASEGQLAVVQWLLENGAKINYTVNGMPRCLPLQFAATNGHLDVVKLLVDNGADWKSSWNGHTALSQAENYGHHDVRDYLRSLK